MTASGNDAMRQTRDAIEQPLDRHSIFTRDCTVREFECGNSSARYSVNPPNLVYSPTAVCRPCLRVDPILLGEFVMPILLWHLPLVIFFGSWDVTVSPSEKRSIEAPFDARLAPETLELPPAN